MSLHEPHLPTAAFLVRSLASVFDFLWSYWQSLMLLNEVPCKRSMGIEIKKLMTGSCVMKRHILTIFLLAIFRSFPQSNFIERTARAR